MERVNSPKVFGLGLSKTGTSSLGEALNMLGIKTIHYPFDENTYNQLYNGQYNLTILNEYDGIVDIPVAPYYAQLDKIYPDSKFILTIRDTESWLKSVDKHWELMMQWWHNYPEFKRFHEFIGVAVYGSVLFNRDRFQYVYETHVKNVIDYFKNNTEQFLVIDICAGEGWKELCSFLNLPVPKQPFPHANEWMHKLMEATAEIKKIIPIGETFILIDQEGFGAEFSAGRQRLPFMEKDGTYCGLPEDDNVALQEFERLHAMGATYLVFGWPCFWWLDYYKEFSNYVMSKYICIEKSDRLIVFELN